MPQWSMISALVIASQGNNDSAPALIPTIANDFSTTEFHFVAHNGEILATSSHNSVSANRTRPCVWAEHIGTGLSGNNTQPELPVRSVHPDHFAQFHLTGPSHRHGNHTHGGARVCHQHDRAGLAGSKRPQCASGISRRKPRVAARSNCKAGLVSKSGNVSRSGSDDRLCWATATCNVARPSLSSSSPSAAAISPGIIGAP